MNTKYNYLKSSNADYIDELFTRYQTDPDSIDESWRYFFDGLELGTPNGHANGSVEVTTANGATETVNLSSEAKVAELIAAYRARGHLLANLDPLNPPLNSHPLLELANFGLTDQDLSKKFTAGKLIGLGPATLKEIIQRLRQTYCSSIGVEFNHIQDPVAHEWLKSKMESSANREELSAETKKFLLMRLTESETFERFLHTRYVAQKRFSLEGAEAFILSLDHMIEVAADLGTNNVVMGMAHRGRLNVLLNIYGKNAQYIFTEFEQNYQTDGFMGEGDVKYHMGYSADVITKNGKPVHLSLAHNPSHLEFVNPVVEGIARAKQRLLTDSERNQVVPIVIHGDAAFAGQGIVYETLNLSQLKGYHTGGTIHVIVNNQVGFTTDPEDSRSTLYSTDLAKMLEVPIFHVNGDDPEAVWYVARISAEYRQKFKKDVFIDLIGYRRYGHNEGDEPAFTQPLMYEKIKNHPSVREIYAKKLVKDGVMSEQESTSMVDGVMQKLTDAQTITRTENPKPFTSAYQNRWKGLRPSTEADILQKFKTAVPEAELKALADKIATVPGDFAIHKKLVRFMEDRKKSIVDGVGIDWGTGETLAYATLLAEGHSIRISGQDVERGTFTHRHAVLHDVKTGKEYTPLTQIAPNQGECIIQNSSLSEAAVLGFEYGWSLADPNALVIWEAQFGDFSNGAQVIIDQFISSSESKWQRACGIVLLLPHGYEGQGPEHSSARLERFLQLCGKNNMAVCNLTTPAQIFHVFRRQLKWEFRKPLVIMTPKSLLRHPMAVSRIEDFSKASFEEVLDDPQPQAKTAKRILLCSGKIYYDILAEQQKRGINKVALLRVEQLYPWPEQQLAKILNNYPQAQEIFWVQEEPRNMGAWSYIFNQWSGGYSEFSKLINNRNIQYIGRERGAAPAVGSMKIHLKEQKEIIEKALGI